MTGITISESFSSNQKIGRFQLKIRTLNAAKNILFSLALLSAISLLPIGCFAQVDQRAAAHEHWSPKPPTTKAAIGENFPVDLPYTWFDAIIGLEHLGVHEGQVYKEKHRVKGKTSKFFPSADFSKGIVQYDNQTYYNLNLKYNVYDDELLLRVENRLGGNILMLYKKKVESFAIQGHKFKNINNQATDNLIPSGFFEISLEGLYFNLFLKHRKLPTQQLESNLVFYAFEDLDKLCLLQYNGRYERIEDINDLVELFPKHEEALKDHYRNQKRKSDFDQRLYSTLKYLETLLDGEGVKIGQQ